MIKRIEKEPIRYSERYRETALLTREEVEEAMERAVEQTRENLKYFGNQFPAPATKGQVYEPMDNTEWTNGFWTGMLWLCYEYTGDGIFREKAEEHVESFLHRVERRIELDHHDLGFLYSPSCVAAYKLTGSEKGKRAGILAADKLMERFQERDGFIQAWGELGAREHYRLIIDCLMNIPLLYWAASVTGEEKYRTAAGRHFEKSCNYVIREDASAFHTFYFNPETGEPVKGVTRQGYSDSSAWARGQAWGIYGIPLNYRENRSAASLETYKAMTNYFLNRLPKDDVCCWDLIFGDGSGQPRDSSAAAIAVCGMCEMENYLPETDPEKEVYRHGMHRILRSLMENYAGGKPEPGSPVLSHGVYSWHSGKGVDEGNIWGDYYYMEGLMRFWKDWNPYW